MLLETSQTTPSIAVGQESTVQNFRSIIVHTPNLDHQCHKLLG